MNEEIEENTVEDPELAHQLTIPDVYYADDFPEDILSMVSPLQDGGYVFELASRRDILDNLGIGFKGNIDPEGLREYLKNRVERRVAEFNALVESLQLQEAQVIQIGDSQIHAYSYRETTPDHFRAVAEALSIIAARTPKAQFMPKNIILLPNLNVQTEVGTPANGGTHTELGTMQLYQRAFTEAEHRVPGVSNLVGTVVHEWGHQFISGGFHQLFEDWLKLGRWKQVEWGKYQTNEPSQCINDYARISPHEDFCESTAAAILKPDYLKSISPRKLDLLQGFLELKQGVNPEARVPYQVIPLDRTKGPEFPTQFRYTLVQR